MTEEREDLMKIFDTIINLDELWNDVKFKRDGKELSIIGKDKYGSVFVYKEILV